MAGGFLRPREAPLPPAGGRVEQLVERLGDAGAEQVRVGQPVAVGGDAVEHLAVVRRHGDRQRVTLHQGRHRVGADHPGPRGVERRLWSRDVGHAQLVAAAQLLGGHPGSDRVERGRREAGDPGEPVGGDPAATLLVRLEGVGDLMQPHDRAGFADRQVDEVGGDLATERGGLELLVDHRDGRDGVDAAEPGHRFRAGHQPRAQTAGDRCQDDVVDGAAVDLPNLAVVGQPGVDGDHSTLLGERPTDRGGALGLAAGERGRHPADPLAGGAGLAERRGGGHQRGVDDGGRFGQRVPERAHDQADRRRSPVRLPGVGLEVLRLRCHVEQQLAEVDGVHSVDERLVGLVEQRHPAGAETLDEVDLPQRSAAVEGPRHNPGNELSELVVGPGARQGGAAYVIADVEVLVVAPQRRGQVPGHGAHPLPVARHERDPVEDQRHQPVVVEPGITGLEDLDRRVVHRRRRRFGSQESQVTRTDPLAHRLNLSCPADRWRPRLARMGF